jgi:hypothetical protein
VTFILLSRRLVNACDPSKLPYSTSCHCLAIVTVVAACASLLLLLLLRLCALLHLTVPSWVALTLSDTLPLYHIGGPQRMDAESLRNSGMLSMLTSAEGREKLQSLAAKVRDRGNNVWRCGGDGCGVIALSGDSCPLRMLFDFFGLFGVVCYCAAVGVGGGVEQAVFMITVSVCC